MLALLKMESNEATTDSLTKLLIGALIVQRDLTIEETALKLLCFDANGKYFHAFQILFMVGIFLWQEVLERMVDIYVLLGMMALLPLLEAVNSLIEFAHKKDIFNVTLW
jgi:hypothetical protein